MLEKVRTYTLSIRCGIIFPIVDNKGVNLYGKIVAIY